MLTHSAPALNPRRPARWPWLAAAMLLFLALLQLGNWQVQRLVWKRDLITRVDARIHAAPVAAPVAVQWPQVTPASHEYLRVRLQGRFLHKFEALTQATTALGQGYWVLTPLQTDEGWIVWVNRGFVSPSARDPSRRGTPPSEGEVTVIGLLRMSEPGGGFLRQNDPSADRWHSRDVQALSTARGLPLERVAPYFVDQQANNAADDPGAGSEPVAGLTVVRFPDNHLIYALTWYGLALGLALALVLIWRNERRRNR